MEDFFYNFWGDALAEKRRKTEMLFDTLQEIRPDEFAAINISTNNAFFLQFLDKDNPGNPVLKGAEHFDMWLRGLMADYVRKGKTPEEEQQRRKDWLANTKMLALHGGFSSVVEWLTDWERWQASQDEQSASKAARKPQLEKPWGEYSRNDVKQIFALLIEYKIILPRTKFADFARHFQNGAPCISLANRAKLPYCQFIAAVTKKRFPSTAERAAFLRAFGIYEYFKSTSGASTSDDTRDLINDLITFNLA